MAILYYFSWLVSKKIIDYLHEGVFTKHTGVDEMRVYELGSRHRSIIFMTNWHMEKIKQKLCTIVTFYT